DPIHRNQRRSRSGPRLNGRGRSFPHSSWAAPTWLRIAPLHENLLQQTPVLILQRQTMARLEGRRRPGFPAIRVSLLPIVGDGLLLVRGRDTWKWTRREERWVRIPLAARILLVRWCELRSALGGMDANHAIRDRDIHLGDDDHGIHR